MGHAGAHLDTVLDQGGVFVVLSEQGEGFFTVRHGISFFSSRIFSAKILAFHGIITKGKIFQEFFVERRYNGG
jgi:hypothetical protein